MKNKFLNDERFKIFTENLKKGGREKIREELEPDFIDVKEERLSFEDTVYIEGEAYVADHELILNLDIKTDVMIPCSICNKPVKTPISLKNIYIAEPLDSIKSGVFSLVDPLREAILLEAPIFSECEGGECPSRKELEKYFKKPEQEGYHPFENLEL